MTPTPELDAAARLLAVLEGAKATALALADAHLPPGRAMALRAAATDPAASLRQATAADARAAELFLAAIRGAATGHVAVMPPARAASPLPSPQPPIPLPSPAPTPARDPERVTTAPSSPPDPPPHRAAHAAPTPEPAPPKAAAAPKPEVAPPKAAAALKPEVAPPKAAAAPKPDVAPPKAAAAPKPDVAPPKATPATPRSGEPARPPVTHADAPRPSAPSVQERGANAASVAAALGVSRSPLGAPPSPRPAEPGRPGDQEHTVQAQRPVSLAELLGSKGGQAPARVEPPRAPSAPRPVVPHPAASGAGVREGVPGIVPTLLPIGDAEFVDDDPLEVTQIRPSLGPSEIGAPARPPAPVSSVPPPRITARASGANEELPEVAADLLEEISEMEEFSDPGGPPPALHADDEPSTLMAPEPSAENLGSGVRAGPSALQLGTAQRTITRAVTRAAPAEGAFVVAGRGEELPVFGAGGGEADDVSLTYDLGPDGVLGAPRLTEEGSGSAPTRVAGADRDRVKEAARVAEFLVAAQAALDKGDIQRAIQCYTDAIQFNPDHVEGFIGRGRCHLEVGDYSSAMSDFQRAEDLAPTRPEPAVAMGDLYFARKEYKRAIDLYDQAIEMDASHAMARCRRGISYYYRKNYKQAFQDLQRAFALDPEIPNIKKYIQMAVKKMEDGG